MTVLGRPFCGPAELVPVLRFWFVMAELINADVIAENRLFKVRYPSGASQFQVFQHTYGRYLEDWKVCMQPIGDP